MICKLCGTEVSYNKSIGGVEFINSYPKMSGKYGIKEDNAINIYTCYNCAKSLFHIEGTAKVLALTDYEPITLKCEKCNYPAQTYIEEITGAELKEEDIKVYNHYVDLVGFADNHIYSVHYCPQCNGYDYVIKRRIKNKTGINKRD